VSPPSPPVSVSLPARPSRVSAKFEALAGGADRDDQVERGAGEVDVGRGDAGEDQWVVAG
jgi:hypothetical protein